MSNRDKGNWLTRRVSFVVSNSYHSIFLVPAKMKVRTLRTDEDDDGAMRFEGRVTKAFERLQGMDARLRGLDCVGVLVADLGGALTRGHIDWVKEIPETTHTTEQSQKTQADHAVP